jgi:hypothetical protein
VVVSPCLELIKGSEVEHMSDELRIGPLNRPLADLTAEEVRRLLRYEPETGKFYREMGSLTDAGYVRVRVGAKTYAAHRLAWLYVHGRWPVDLIDHINGDKQDNRIANLREATASENAIYHLQLCAMRERGFK